MTFLLTSGGHNAGIISEPGHPHRHYRIRTKPKDASLSSTLIAGCRETEAVDGSWWPALVAWLAEKSGKPTAPPPMGAAKKGFAPICEAPGTYVFQA